MFACDSSKRVQQMTLCTIRDRSLTLSCFVPLPVFRPMMTWLIVLPQPPMGFSVSQGVSSVTSPSYTSFVSLIRSPERGQHQRKQTNVRRVRTHLRSTDQAADPFCLENNSLHPRDRVCVCVSISDCNMAKAFAVLSSNGAAVHSWFVYGRKVQKAILETGIVNHNAHHS